MLLVLSFNGVFLDFAELDFYASVDVTSNATFG